MFQIRVLAKLHQERMIEWDKVTDTVVLSPKGVADVEARLISTARQ